MEKLAPISFAELGVIKVEFHKSHCEPDHNKVYFEAVEQPKILGRPQKDGDEVRDNLILRNRITAFGSPAYTAYTLASRSVIRAMNEVLDGRGYPLIEIEKFLNIDHWWNPETMIQTRSPLVSLPAISKQAGNLEDDSIFSKVTKGDGVWRFEYLANQDTWKRRDRNFAAVVYVSFDGELLCAKANHQQIIDAGF